MSQSAEIAGPGHNNPPAPTPAHEVEGALLTTTWERLNSRFIALPKSLDETSAAKVRDVKAEATKAINEGETTRKVIQKPFEDTLHAIRAAFRGPTEKLERLKLDATQALTIYLQEEDLRIQAAAKEAHERAVALANQADVAQINAGGAFAPMDEVDDAIKEAAEAELVAEHATKLAESGPKVASFSGLAKAAGFRSTWGVKVLEHRKLVHKYRDNPDVIEAARKIAAAEMRATKGTARIPGCEAVETRTAT